MRGAHGQRADLRAWNVGYAWDDRAVSGYRPTVVARFRAGGCGRLVVDAGRSVVIREPAPTRPVYPARGSSCPPLLEPPSPDHSPFYCGW
jgi:hypothetical protein